MPGEELMAEHREADLLNRYFASKDFQDMDHLMGAVRCGVPVDVTDGGDFKQSMWCGNYLTQCKRTKL